MTQGTGVLIQVSAWAQPHCRGETQDIPAHVCTPTVLLNCDLGMSPCFPSLRLPVCHMEGFASLGCSPEILFDHTVQVPHQENMAGEKMV